MKPREPQSRPVRFLLVGYNGANNTGSEARLLSIVDDLRRLWGKGAHLTVLSLNAANLRRYLREDETLEIVECAMIFFATVRREVHRADAVLLVEGSCFMDSWAAPLLWFFLWAARCAAREGKPCIAYAVDAGRMSAFNEWLTVLAARDTHLVLRTRLAAERMRGLGMRGTIECTADTAFYFDASAGAEPDETLLALGLDPIRPTVGMSLVDFSVWPVVVRLWGPRGRCYRWPYYFSESAARRRSADAMAQGYAALARRILEVHGANLLLVAMEELDERFLARVRERLNWSGDERVAVASARTLDAASLTRLLRTLTLLITSRYHASVLSLEAGVPQFAIGHDLRLKTLYQEIGLFPSFFLEPEDGSLWEHADALTDSLLRDATEQRARLRTRHAEQLGRALRNREVLARLNVHRAFRATAELGPERTTRDEPKQRHAQCQTANSISSAAQDIGPTESSVAREKSRMLHNPQP